MGSASDFLKLQHNSGIELDLDTLTFIRKLDNIDYIVIDEAVNLDYIIIINDAEGLQSTVKLKNTPIKNTDENLPENTNEKEEISMAVNSDNNIEPAAPREAILETGNPPKYIGTINLPREFDNKRKLGQKLHVLNLSEASKADFTWNKINMRRAKEKKFKPLKVRGKVYKFNGEIIRGPPFACDRCEASYKTFEEYQEHRRKAMHHVHELPAGPPYKCTICDQLLLTPKEYRCHINSFHRQKTFKCPFCEKAFKTKYALTSHSVIHTKELPFECNICHKRYPYGASLKRHVDSHARKYSICFICGKKLARKTDLRYHERHVHGIKHNEGKSEPTLVQFDQTVGFGCKMCQKIFATEESLKTHIESHNMTKKPGEYKKHVCEICGKEFNIKGKLTVHIQRHKGERNFGCTICNKMFYTKSDLKIHIRIHTRETTYQCKICYKRFSHVSNFKKHQQSHFRTEINLLGQR